MWAIKLLVMSQTFVTCTYCISGTAVSTLQVLIPNPHNNSRRQKLLLSLFTDEETEKQRNYIVHPRSHVCPLEQG